MIAGLLDHLAWASMAIALMVGAAWLLCRLRPSLAPSTRSTIWWWVAAAALLRLAPIPGLTFEVSPDSRLASFLPAAPAPSAAPRSPVATKPVVPFVVPSGDTPIEAFAQPLKSGTTAPHRPSATDMNAPTSARAGLDWRTALAGLWCVIAGALLLHLAIATRRLRALARTATPVGADIADEADRLAAALGLRTTPPVRVSAAIDTPQVFGLLHPTVLLPAEALAVLSRRERTMTLCHELAHVRRRDLALAWAPALMERLLFFHPGARLAAREYAFAREAACDAEVLQHLGETPRDYGRLLLRLGVTRRPAALAAAQSSPSTRLLRRRLAMLNDHESTPRVGRGLWLAGTLLLPLALPLSLVARQAEVTRPPSTGVAGGINAGVRGGVATGVGGGVGAGIGRGVGGGIGSGGGLGSGSGTGGSVGAGVRSYSGSASEEQEPPPPPPPPPPAPRERTPPPPPPPPPPPADGGGYWVNSRNGNTIMLFDGNGSTTFSGTNQDMKEATRLRGSSGGPFLFIRSNGTAYASRDRALIDRVRQEFDEQRELGERQGLLGAEQGALGTAQADLGRLQAEMGAKFAAAAQASDAAHNGSLRALESALHVLERDRTAQTAELEAARRAVREAMEALRRSTLASADEASERSAAARAEAQATHDRQQEIVAEHRALAEKQAALGQRQAELGRQQQIAAETAAERIRVIIEKAVAAGEIQPVK